MGAINIANYFIQRANENTENDLTNLKLQKVLYFAQGKYLGKYGKNKPLFSEPIEAWQLGPVVRDVYNIFSICGSSPITVLDIPENSFDDLDETITSHLDYIWGEYGKYSASYLVDLTHSQAPWKKNYQPNSKNTIPLEDMATFFEK